MQNLDTPKTQTLEQKISSALAANDATSDTLAALINETETAVSDGAARIELERALNISTNPDPVAAHRTITEAEFLRARLKLALPELQQKFATARAREESAQWEIEYHRVEALCDKMAEKWARVPGLIDELIGIFTENEALNKQISRVNGAAAPGEHRRLLDAELLWRGLKAFSRSQPPQTIYHA